MKGRLRFAAQMLNGHTLRLLRFEKERARQFGMADLLAVPSPPAVARHRELARRYGGPAMENKVCLVPHPIASWFQWDGTEKEKRVAAVGRWDDHLQKRPDLLAASIEAFLGGHPDWQADIFGNPGDFLGQWRAGLAPELRTRVTLHGRVTSRDLSTHLNRTRILVCSSAYESFHIASGEALCSGVSVVGTDAGMTASHRWFVSENSGSLSPRLDASDLAAALATEAEHWQQGRRDPAAIATTWSARLHAPHIVKSLVERLANQPTERGQS